MKHYEILLASILLAFLCSYGIMSQGNLNLIQQAQSYISSNSSNTSNTSNFTRVHVIAHTHDDVGWTHTVDNYYTTEVRYILDTVINELVNDQNKKFIYVEIAYFQKWWYQQGQEMQNQVRLLVANGQLSFSNGGWVMHDEACTYYEDMIDQMTLGHRFLSQTFNFVPTVGWQIDPFGHSNANAAMFSDMGFNGVFFPRIDFNDKQNRLNTQNMEFIQSPVLFQSERLFTQINFHHYSAPPSFCFSFKCDDPDIVNNTNFQTYNVESRANDLVDYFKNMSKYYKHNTTLMHTFGDDFEYRAAKLHFKNMDILFDFINSHQNLYNMSIFYSTPDAYLKDIHTNYSTVGYSMDTTDFFPYEDEINAFWTGYFTSRPTLKYMIKTTGRYLQSVRTMFSLLQIKYQAFQNMLPLMQDAIYTMEDAMAIAQHHDAVTGTERQSVANDYNFRINNATDTLNSVLYKVVNTINSAVLSNENATTYQQCNWNDTSFNCTIVYNAINAKKSVLLTVYNPTGDRDEVLRIKVPNVPVTIVDTYNRTVQSDIFCSNNTDATDCDLYMQVFLKNYTFHYFKITPAATPAQNNLVENVTLPRSFPKQSHLGEQWPINQDGYYTFKLGYQRDDPNDNQISGYSTVGINLTTFTDFQFTNCDFQKGNCSYTNFSLSYNYYQSYIDGATDDGQTSGAYIFRPNANTINGSIPYMTYTSGSYFIGKIVTIISLYSPNITTQLKFYNSENSTFICDDISNNMVEIETFVNSIYVGDGQGREVTMNVKMGGVQNNGTFFTDSNGLWMQQRQLNFRSTWPFINTQPVSGNYYPVQMAQVKDLITLDSFYLLTDRAEGGSSYRQGEFEVMIHRRLTQDDGRGVDEPLDEAGYDGLGLKVKLRHYILFTNKDSDRNLNRRLQFFLDQPPIVVYSDTAINGSFSPNSGEIPTILYTGEDIPELMKLYIRNLDNTNYLFRVQNINESPFYQLNTNITNATELSLSGNQLLTTMNMNKYYWKIGNDILSDDEEEDITHPKLKNTTNRTQVFLNPLQIRTFNLSFYNLNLDIVAGPAPSNQHASYLAFAISFIVLIFAVAVF